MEPKDNNSYGQLRVVPFKMVLGMLSTMVGLVIGLGVIHSEYVVPKLLLQVRQERMSTVEAIRKEVQEMFDRHEGRPHVMTPTKDWIKDDMLAPIRDQLGRIETRLIRLEERGK